MSADLYRNAPTQINKKLLMNLPVPPSVNHMYINTRFGGKRLTSKAEDYIRISKALINQFVEEQNWAKIDDHTWMYVDLVFYFPDRRVRDSHNCLKLLLDVMQDIVYKNDYHVMPRIQSVEYDKENPRVDILITHQDKLDRTKGLKMTAN